MCRKYRIVESITSSVLGPIVPNGHITQEWRKDNVFTTSTRRRRRRVDVVKTLLLRRMPARYRYAPSVKSITKM